MKLLEDLSAERQSRICDCISKHKKGGYIVRKILTDCTYSYVDKLFDALVSRLQSRDVLEAQIELPAPMCASFDKPNKEDAVAKHTSRFN